MDSPTETPSPASGKNLSSARGPGGSFVGGVVRGAGGTILSRVLGLVRDGAIAYVFGASAGYDAFLVALYIPQALRQILGEGGLASAFLPVYAQARERGEGEALARSALMCLLFFLPLVCALGVVLAPAYVPVLAAGFDLDTMNQTVALARWVFPLIGFISLTALASGILNAHGRFFLPALSPAALNVGMIVGAVFLSRLTHPPSLGLALGSLVGGGTMVAVLLPYLRSLLRGFGPLWPPHPSLKEVGWRLLPSLGALVVTELNTLVDNRLASHLAPGSIATLQYAMRLFQLPLGVLAVSVSTVALPLLSRWAAQGNRDGFRESLEQGFAATTTLILPALVGLLLVGKPILAVLFQRGEFTAADTARTYAALTGYLCGLWAYALVYLFSRAWFALGRPVLPFLAGGGALVVNIGLNLWWVQLWGTFGLALATGVAGWVNALLLGVPLWRCQRGWIATRYLVRVTGAVGGMTGALLLLRPLLSPCGPWVEAGVAVPLGLVLYATLAWILGLTRFSAGAR